MKHIIRLGLLAVVMVVLMGVSAPAEAIVDVSINGVWSISYADADCTLIRTIDVGYSLTGTPGATGDDGLLDLYYLLIREPGGNPIMNGRNWVFIQTPISDAMTLVANGNPLALSGTYEALVVDTIFHVVSDSIYTPEQLDDNIGVNASVEASTTFTLDALTNLGWYNPETHQLEECPEPTDGGSGGGSVDIIIPIWEPPTPPTPVDDRVDHPLGHVVVLYNRTDDHGEPALYVYCVNEQSEGNYQFMITQSEFQRAITDVLQPAINDGANGAGFSLGDNRGYIKPLPDDYCPHYLFASAYLNPNGDSWIEIRVEEAETMKLYFLSVDGIPASEVTMIALD